jgi:hypothetical protein
MAKTQHPGEKVRTDAPSIERRTGPSKYGSSEPYSLADPNREWHIGNSGPSAWAARDSFYHGKPWAGVKRG